MSTVGGKNPTFEGQTSMQSEDGFTSSWFVSGTGTRYVFLKGPWPGVVDTDDQLSVSPTYDVMLGTWPLVTPG